MVEAYATEWANKIWHNWQPGLYELKPRYEEPIFPALVAFCGLQNILWPLWLRSCAVAGQPLSAENRVFYIADPELHKYPWALIFNPLDTQSAWVLVRGAGLPDSAAVFPGLMLSDMTLTLQTMTEDCTPIIHGKARDLFLEWGVLKGDNKVVFFPVVQCERLAEEWPLWQNSARSLEALFIAIAKEQIALGRKDSELRLDFLELADALWRLMQQEKIIQCAPFRGGESLLRFFDLKKKPKQFNGILMLLGDHQRLWNIVRN